MEKEACLGVVAECGGPFRSAKQPIQNLESNICKKERWLPSGAAAWLRRPRQSNRYLLGQSFQGFAIFSIALSVLFLSNTVWYYAYWNLFRCKPIRDVPSSLSLYNYKLSGVKEGVFSFGKLSHDVSSVNEIEMADNMLSVTIADTVLNDSSRTAGDDSDKQIDELPKKAHAEGGSEIEVVRPARDDQDTESDALRKALQ